MSRAKRVILVGVLADPAICAALGLGAGRAVRVPGALSGGARAGIELGGWPVYDPFAPGGIEGIEVARSPALDRYAEIMGLTALPSSAGPLLGARAAEDGTVTPQARAAGAGDADSGHARDAGQGAAMASSDPRPAAAAPPSPLGPVPPQPSDPHTPPAPQPALAAAIAAALLDRPFSVDAAALRRRLPMIGVWAASQLRAVAETGRDPAGPAVLSDAASQPSTFAETSDETCAETSLSTPPNPGPDAAPPPAADTHAPPTRPLPGDPAPSRIRILSRREPYAHFFSVEALRLTHRLHDGGWSAPLERAVFVSGDAVVVLPWDPVRDRVLVIDQFRAGPAARRDADPWLIEAVAGRIDAGETPASTAHREAQEEAGLTLQRLIPAPGHYPSPAILAEYLYSFIGIADLPDGSARVAGLDSEGEDIRGHLLPRAHLTRMALEGRLANGPLILLTLWLDRMAETLLAG